MLRWIGRIAVGIVVLLAVLAGGGWLWLRSSLPQTDGTIALAGLDKPVEITRDRHGIPHIRAQTERDAHFALGFVHAQDRLWQMDFQRRLGAGRLSEVVGARALPTDRYMRTLGLYRLAEKSVARMSSKARAIIDAYTAGVNAYIASRTASWSAWPIEFYLMRYRPEPWKPADSLVWGRMMGIYLSRDFRDEALRARIRAKLGAAALDTLFPAYPAGAPRTLASLLDDVPNPFAQSSASNAWALAGTRTATGKPFLANDPHLRFRVPALWYLARIETPTLLLAGATVPGVPFMILGHNRKITWGITSTEIDVEDLFVEEIEKSDPTWYRTPEGARPFTTRTEIIKVRDRPDVALEVRETRHGPVLSDISPTLKALTPAGHVMALATPALWPDDDSPTALYRLNRAGGWQQFRDALRRWGTPVQNITYADTDGNIGLIVPGRIPVRKTGDGSLPSPGSPGTHDWTGTIPFDALPQVFNPAKGYVANANNPTAPATYPYKLGRGRIAGYRARRIDQLVQRKATHDRASMSAIQLDTVSLMARDMIPLLLAARPRSEKAAEVHAMLRGWNGVMAREIPQPLIFIAWMRALDRRIFADELGPLYAEYRGLNPLAIRTVLTRDRQWCDDRTTRAVESCDDILAAALDDAIAELTDAYGSRPTRWQWGTAHEVRFDHSALGRVPVLGALFNIRFPVGGGPYTINRGQINPSDRAAPYASVHGAGYRAVYDLADLDRSRFIIAPGQSGNWFSSHYGDLATLWRDGVSLTIPHAPAGDLPTLRLMPERKR